VSKTDALPRAADGAGSPLARLRAKAWTGPVLAALRVLVVLAVVAAVGVAVAHDWSAVRTTVGRLTWLDIVLALGAACAALLANSKVWQAVLSGVGTQLHGAHAAQVYLTGQLARYLPGSVWAFALQAHLGRRHEVPRNRSLVALLLAVMVTFVTGMCFAMAALPALRVKWGALAWLLLLAPLGLVILVPRLLTFVTNRMLAIIRRPQLSARIPGAVVAQAAGWSVIAWLLSGAQLWILVHAVHPVAAGSYFGITGAFAVAVCAGFFAFVLPSGVGVREVVVVAGLSAVLATGPALAVALISRLLCTAADVLTAFGSVLVSRLIERHHRAQTPGRT